MASLMAAPAIVKANVLMPIKPLYDTRPGAELRIISKFKQLLDKGIISQFGYKFENNILSIWPTRQLSQIITCTHCISGRSLILNYFEQEGKYVADESSRPIREKVLTDCHNLYDRIVIIGG